MENLIFLNYFLCFQILDQSQLNYSQNSIQSQTVDQTKTCYLRNLQIIYIKTKLYQQQMKHARVAYKVQLKGAKDKDIWTRRQESHIPGTPKVVLGKLLENGIQQIWIQELKNEPVVRLKELNTDQRAINYARTIIYASCQLARTYGCFIINENMVFSNNNRDVFAWINPDPLENSVKIYLPNSSDGELSMIRGIIAYLKLWLKIDFAPLAQSKRLEELLGKFDSIKNRLGEFKPRSPGRQFVGVSKSPIHLSPNDNAMIRFSGSMRVPGHGLLMQNRSNRQFKSPGKEQEKLLLSMSSKQKNPLRGYQSSADQEKLKSNTQSRNTQHISSEKNGQQSEAQFEHKSFHNINPSTKISLSSSQKIDPYFPNKTTQNKHILVQLIQSLDNKPEQFKQNKLLLSDQAYRHQEEMRRMQNASDPLEGIGEEVNELFFSNIQSDGHKEQEIKRIQQQFGSLLD